MNFQEIMACHKDNEEAYKQLAESVAKNNIVPFIGAGLSAWKYPAWSKLLIDMASDYGIDAEIRTMLDSGQYEEAASRLDEEMTSFDFLRDLEKKYDPTDLESIELPEIYKHITSIWRGNVATTNFDRILEKAYRNAQIELDAITPYDVFINRVDAAIQQSKNLIIKLHGDVNDKDNMVLTKNKYDECYGVKEVNMELPMPKALKRILQARQLLFLGCSLHQDRTMQVIQAVSNCTHFAIVALPEETKNEKNPMLPNLKDDEDIFHKSYLERRKHLASHNIVRIWYPYGEHDAVKVILKELAKEFGKAPKVEPKEKNDFRYEHLHDLFGRDEKVAEIVKDMSNSKGGNVFVISGPPGIGKTELCRGVYKKLKEDFVTLDMPYVDCTGVTTMEAFYYKLAEELHMSLPDAIKKDQLLEQLISHIDKKTKASKFILYFDNWEDVWYGVKDAVPEKKELHKFMQTLKVSHTDVLMSTREYPAGWAKTPSYSLDPLDEEPAKKLFLSIYDSKQNSTDEILLNGLLKEIGGYPLALVLVASQAAKMPSLKILLSKWQEAKAETGRESHNSMEVAVRMSWNAIAHIESAKHIWGVLSLASAELSYELLEEVMTPSYKNEWLTGLIALKDANLIFYRNEKVAMLAPLKNLCFKLYETTETKLEESCLMEFGKALCLRVKNAYNDEPDHITSHHALLDVFDEILSVIEKLMKIEEDNYKKILRELVRNMTTYFVRSHKSIDIVEKLCMYYNDEPDILADLIKSRGDIQFRLNDVENAKKSYFEAEQLYRSNKNNFGLAYVFQSLGVFYKHLGDLSNAEKSYLEAERLHRLVKDNIGLANVLSCCGDLQLYFNNFQNARTFYEEAMIIYKNMKNNLGLANELSNLGVLYKMEGVYSEALKCYTEAEKLYREERYNSSLGKVLSLRGDLQSRKGEFTNATQSYLEAESLFRAEQDKLGLANVLRFHGDLYRRLGKYTKAAENYCEAGNIYEELQHKLGIANVYRMLALLLIENNSNSEGILKLLEEAKLFYESIKMNADADKVQEDIYRYLEQQNKMS